MGYAAPYELGYKQGEGADGGAGNYCTDGNVWGYVLGTAAGLQYSTRERSKCYQSIETTVLTVDAIF